MDNAISQLMEELAKGNDSGEENGWLTLEEVETYLGIEQSQNT